MITTESSIRDAYRRLARQRGDFVSLTKIRSLLVDLYTQQAINLVPQSNQRELTPMDRSMAVRCGGEDKHLMSIS